MVAWKASCSQVVQTGDNSTSVKILQLFTYGDTQVIQSIACARLSDSIVRTYNSVYNTQFTRRWEVLYQSMSQTEENQLRCSRQLCFVTYM